MNPAAPSNPVAKKHLFLFLVIAVVCLSLVAVAVLSLGQTPQQTDSPPKESDAAELSVGNCPDEVAQKEGRPVAIKNGRELQMSAATYAWVQANCGANKASAAPVLANLGLSLNSFAEYSQTTGRAGAFVFDQTKLSGNWPINKVMFEMGLSVATDSGSKVLPEITYAQIDLATDILAMSSGKVVEVSRQSGGDYAIAILHGEDWVTLYDHVTNVTVSINEQVMAGKVLGKPAVNRDGTTGFVEIAIKRVDSQNKSYYYCPLAYLASAEQSAYANKFAQLMRDWESFTGNTEIYAEATAAYPGCLQSEVVE